jgi:DNA-binding NarL/FixJ family response regulator
MNSAAPPVAGTLDGEKQEVILEVEVAGVRYLLLRSRPTASPTRAVLSRREEEIVHMVAKGYPNKTIAATLDISPWTVCTYIRRIFAKVGVCSRAAMVARLLEKGSIQKYK